MNDIYIYGGATVLLMAGVLIERLINPRKKVQQHTINDAVDMFEDFKTRYERDNNEVLRLQKQLEGWQQRADNKIQEVKDLERYARDLDKQLYEWSKGRGHGKNLKCPCCEEYRRRKEKKPIPRGDDYDNEQNEEITEKKELKNINIKLK